jgi:hypothetical protein
MAAGKWFWPFLLVVLLAGCASGGTTPHRIALLGPFEGRLREIGYNAYYAMQLALADLNGAVVLVAVDDGGSPEQAASRARALATDASIGAVLLIGPHATTAEVQRAARADQSLVLIGDWGQGPVVANAVFLSAPEMRAHIDVKIVEITTAATMPLPLTLDETGALVEFTALRGNPDRVVVFSTGRLPDPAFTARYQEQSVFAPAPNLLAMQAYDALGLAAHALDQAKPIHSVTFEGLLGRYSFQDGYWVERTLRRFTYDGATLVQNPP